MKVLMLAQFYPPTIGGEERHVRNLAIELTRRGHDVHVATQAVTSSDVGTSVEDDVQVHRLQGTAAKHQGLYSEGARPHALPVPDPGLTRALARVRDEVRPDVVHAHNWIVHSFVPLQLRHRSPLVLTLHDYSDRCATKRFMYRGAICSGPGPRKCLAHAAAHYGGVKGPPTLAGMWAMRVSKHRVVDRYVTVSRAVALGNGLAEAGVPHQVIPNFVPDMLCDTSRSAERPVDVPHEPYLIFVGDLVREKGVHTLLEAYDRMPDGRPGLLLIGRRHPETPQGLPRGVRIGESWPHERIVAAFQHALAAVLPSEWGDPCPTTVLEAMALGTPVVTTDVGGMVDMVQADRSGIVVRAGDAASLQAGLERVVEDHTLRARLVEGARVQVRSFTAGAVARRIEQVYSDAIEDHRGNR